MLLGYCRTFMLDFLLALDNNMKITHISGFPTIFWSFPRIFSFNFSLLYYKKLGLRNFDLVCGYYF